MCLEPEIPRVVKTRKPHDPQLPILAVSPTEILDEERTVRPRVELAELLQHHAGAYVIAGSPVQLLRELHRELRSEHLWQFRLSPLERERVDDQGNTRTIRETIVGFFGFRRPNGRSHARYFYPLSPGTFCRSSVRELVNDQDVPYPELLMRWGESVRAFCQEYELRPTPTAGGMASQLLRHPLFYPNPRRKVPRATNEKARVHLPGNHYQLHQAEGVPVGAALYIDQADAHHSSAEAIALPHADRLVARGRFNDVDAEDPWVRFGSMGWEALARQHGLLRLAVTVPLHLAQREFAHPCCAIPGDRVISIYTNELPELLELGLIVRWAVSAWTSTEPDAGISRYASWSRRQLRERPDDRGWLKPTLLAAYGILAAKPRRLEFAYWWARSGEPATYLLGSEEVQVTARRTERLIQSPIANVIQRGMIEAETRRRSLALARDLAERDFDVLSVYADGVIVRDTGKPLPLMPAPWRVKERLSHLIFHSPQAFTSTQLQRLPGSPKTARMRSDQSDTHNRKGTPNGNVGQGQGVRPSARGRVREGRAVPALRDDGRRRGRYDAGQGPENRAGDSSPRAP